MAALRIVAATVYLGLGEFYLAAHWPLWSPARSLAVFVTLLASAVVMLRIKSE